MVAFVRAVTGGFGERLAWRRRLIRAAKGLPSPSVQGPDLGQGRKRRYGRLWPRKRDCVRSELSTATAQVLPAKGRAGRRHWRTGFRGGERLSVRLGSDCTSAFICCSSLPVVLRHPVSPVSFSLHDSIKLPSNCFTSSSWLSGESNFLVDSLWVFENSSLPKYALQRIYFPRVVLCSSETYSPSRSPRQGFSRLVSGTFYLGWRWKTVLTVPRVRFGVGRSHLHGCHIGPELPGGGRASRWEEPAPTPHIGLLFRECFTAIVLVSF